MRRVAMFFLAVNVILFGCGKPESAIDGRSQSGSRTSGSAPSAATGEGAAGKIGGSDGLPMHETVLSIGDTTISYMEFLDQVRQTNVSPSDNREVILQRLVDAVVRENYLYRHLVKSGFNGGPLLPYDRKYRADDWLAYRYQEVVLPEKIRIDEDQLRKALPPEFLRLKASEIAVASEEEARRALARIRGGEPFEKVAKEISVSPSAAKGGAIEYDFIWGHDELYGGGIEDRLFRAGIGEIVGPVSSPWGYNLFRVESKSPLSEEEKKGVIHTKRNAVYSGNYTRFLQALKTKHPMSVKKEDLRKAAGDPAGSLNVVVAEVGRNRIPFGQVRMYQNAVTVGGREPRNAEEWGAVLSSMYSDLAFREEAVAQGMLEDPLVKDNLRRLDKALLVRSYQEKKATETAVQESEIRESYEKIVKAYPKQRTLVLDLYRFDFGEMAGAARHALEKGQGVDFLEKTFGLDQAKFYTPSVQVYEAALAGEFREPLEKARPGDLVGPVEVFEGGEPKHYLVKVQKISEGSAPNYSKMRDNIKAEIVRMKVEREIARLAQKGNAETPLEWRNREEMEKGIRVQLEKKASGKKKGHPGGGMGGH